MSATVFDPKPNQQAPLELVLTPAAIAHLKKQLGRAGGKVLRLGVKESGCSGYMYELNLVDAPDPEDRCHVVDDELRLYVRPEHLGLVRGTEIDFQVQGLNAALKFINPNAETECGCGESFSVSQTG